MEAVNTHYKLGFLQGGGELGNLTRAYNWDKTPLGSPYTWPQSLRTTLGILLHSAFPMFLFWGPEYLCFYNDAYRPSLGDNGKHPCVGKPGKEVWPEIWDFIGPLIEQVLATGEPVWFEDQFLPIFRNGAMEDVYWTFSYSPAYGDSGEIAGVLVTCTETTRAVVERKKLETSEHHLRELVMAAEFSVSLLTGRELKIALANERNIRDWGKGPDIIGKTVAEALPELQGQPFLKLLDDVYTTGRPYYGYAEPATFIADGKPVVRYYDYAYKPMRDTEGVIWAILVTGTEVTERVQQQRELEQQKAHLQNALDIADLGTFVVDVAANTGSYSENIREWFGLEGLINEMPGILGKVHFADAPAVRKAIARSLTNGSDSQHEITYRVTGANGITTHYLRSIGKVIFADGKPATITGIIQNVSSLHKHQEALAASEQRFRDLVMQAPFGVAVYRGESLIAEVVNNQSLALMGKTREEMEGHPLFQVMPQIRERIEPLITDIMQHGKVVHRYEIPTRSFRDGKEATAYFNSTWTPFRDAEGRIDGIMVVGYDVTEQVLARLEIESSGARFRSIIEEAPVATCLFTGRELVIEIANSAMIAHMGKGPGIIGKPLAEALPELAGQAFLSILDNVFASGEMFKATATPVMITTDGKPRQGYFDYTFKPLLNAAGEAWAIINMSVDVTEQVQAQQRIEENQRQILDSFEQSPVGIAIIDNDEGLSFRMANAFYCTLVSRRPEDIIGKPLLEALPEIKEQGFDDLLRGVINTGVAYTANEVAVGLMRDNRIETLYLDFAYQPRREADGSVSGVLAVIIDVTQQVSARKQIEDSEQRLRSMVESAPFPIGIYEGRELRIILANDSIKAAYGKGPDVEGQLYTELLPELEGTGIFEQLRSVIDTGQAVHMRYQRVDLVQDGVMTENYFNYSFTPLYDAGGNVYAVMNTAAEVTDVVKARMAVEEAQAALSGAIELAELATWEVDARTGKGACSERLAQWIGMTAGEDPLAAFTAAVHEGDRQRVTASLQAVLQAGSPGSYDEEYRLIHRETGQERIIHAQGKTRFLPDGTVLGISGTAQDITAQRRQQEELERQVAERTAELAEANAQLMHSNEELAQYAYVASHDLQEPLRKIRVFSGMLGRQADLTTTSQGLVDKIDHASKRMTLLIKDLLDFSRLLNSESLIQPVELAAICRAVVNDFELTITEKGAQVHISTLPQVAGVGLQMNQLFYNLVSNALKFSRPEVAPRISIESRPMLPTELRKIITHPNPAWLYYDITIKDNGIGFETRYAEQIFEVFKRLHGRDVYPGSGIGLALCRRIAINAKGYLYAESTPGQGATFHIILPDRLR